MKSFLGATLSPIRAEKTLARVTRHKNKARKTYMLIVSIHCMHIIQHT